MHLEGATNIGYEARDDVPGVVFTRPDEDEQKWTPVVVKKSGKGGKGYDAKYLSGGKTVKYFVSESGPSFSIWCGHCRFPTCIACRTSPK